MTTKTYIVTNAAGANLRTCPSTTYPTSTSVKTLSQGALVQVICDWTATNSVGSTTLYYPVLVDDEVLYCSAALLSSGSGEAVLETAKDMGDYMVANSYRYRTDGETMATTFAASKTSGKKGCTCTRFVSWVLQDSGHMKSGKILGHDMSGQEYLQNCLVLESGKSAADLLADEELLPGDVLVSAKATAGGNMCGLFAGYDGPTWYEAGGPFYGTNCEKSTNVYIKIGPLKVNYDATHPKVEYIIRPL